MFIVWGKKVVHRKLGYVADFCPICRCPKVCLVRRIGVAGHVYYLSFGEGALAGFDRICQDCGTAYQANPEHYKSFSKRVESLATLLSQTFPNLDEVWKDRMEVEQKIRSAPSELSPGERTALIREPFLRLSPKVEQRFASTHLDKETGFAALGALGLVIVAPPLSRAIAPDQDGAVLLTALTLGVLLVGWQIAISGRRYVRRQVLPALATSLKPLRPTRAEIGDVLSELKRLKHKLGSKLTADDVSKSLET